MKTLKKNAFAIALSIAVGAGSLVVADEANAAYRSYVEYVERYEGNVTVQLSLSEMLLPYAQQLVGRYDELLTRYAAYSHLGFYQDLLAGRAFYQAEVEYFNTIISGSATEETVELLRTETSTEDRVTVTRSEPYEIDRTESTEQVTLENTLEIYDVLLQVFQTDITTTTTRVTTVTEFFSNGTNSSSTSSAVVNTEVTYEQTTEETRTLVETLPLPTDSNEELIGDGTPTDSVLTVEAYSAREDVMLFQTDTFVNTIQEDFGYSESLIRSYRALGLYGNDLDIVNAPDAWARGWTGKGSTIAILDSGIDSDHSEFAGRIMAQECFTSACTNEGVEDLNGHGTHVAGIAAAAFDGAGTTGVAFDAELLVGKVADQAGRVNMSGVAQGLDWANSMGATVSNLSLGYTFSTAYTDAVSEIESGAFAITNPNTSTLDSWNRNGYLNLESTSNPWELLPSMISALTDSEMVVVAAAGNQGLAYSGYPGHYAVHTDDAGNLTFNGQIIVAGAYDVKTGDLATFSNAAGTLCIDTETGGSTCDSGYRVSDFYLMAPGAWVVSADNDGGYTAKSGTSMAAPVISGAVAVIHQMWPHMTGANLAKLLLETGDKSFAGYDVHRHGQGLLDLDAATSPIGELGIPTTGRASGAKTSDFGQIGLAGSAETLAAEVLSSVMVIDDYDRDFYVDASNLVAPVDTRTQSLTIAHKDLINTNLYAGYAADAKFAGGSQLLFGMSPNGESYNLAYDFDSGISLGYVTEEGTFLGNTMDSDLMRIDNAATAYLGYNFDRALNTKVSIFGGATAGFTSVEVDQSTMLNSADVLVSNTANLGARFDTTAGEFGLVAALPVAITSGDAKFSVASDIDFDGNIVYRDIESSLASKNREYNLGLFYNTEIGSNAKLSAYAEKRFNYAGIEGKNELEAGVEFKLRF